ncbi:MULTISPECIES: hypothetical protein [Natrinema]|uniref:Uncharacterized protein n=1 Tax=Natrinema gari JCM 14663 TaxID=1230459 RepID=L9Z1T7_9EURY|nr:MULTISPECIES: hypothetical protein [Natrinema]AFO57773.1 hypothetical protein NJ7G_2542 [Natrinema sp. J7-2]ELY80465.1 hypothetical protein C486_08680 [Natrinema gari JCM 14663]
MASLFVFLAHRSLLDQHTAHGEIQTWLCNQGGCRDVRYAPSSIRRYEVCATIDPEILLGEPSHSETAELRVEFEFPDDTEHDYYEIQWIDGERNYSFGWHQDETHPDLGKCHFQLDHRDETVARKPAVFHDSHPVTVLEQRLSLVPSILELVAWENDRPRLSRWPPDDV